MFGNCYNCKKTWDIVKPHNIWYTKDKAMFPVCEECYQKLSSKEIKKYIILLLLEWKRQELIYELTSNINIDEIVNSAMITVYKDKSNE